jgi:tetratricopeptide (TPR) repeat protein
MERMQSRGNILIAVIVVIAIAIALFLIVPLGGKVGQLREAAISFIFRKPPQFISMEVDVEGVRKVVKAGESLKIKGGETIIITKIHANTFFESYLTADVVGFGKPNDMNEPIDTVEIRNQLIAAGIKSVPIDVYYLDQKIAKVPLELDLTEQDFINQIKSAKSDEEKISLLRSGHTTFPKNNYFLEELDKLLSAKEDYQALVGIYKGVVEADPANVAAYSNLSAYYIKLKNYNEALAMCQKIIDAGKPDAVIYRRMAYIEGEKGDLEKRVLYLKKALELDKQNETVVVDLAKTYEQAGMKQKALDVYQSASDTAKDRDILIPLIQNALKTEEYTKAGDLLKRYIVRYPQDKNALAQLAMVMGKLGDTKGQVTYYLKAAELSPGDSVIWYNLGVAREKLGDNKGALDAYTKVLRIKQGDMDSLQGAAGLSLKLGQYKDAYAYYSTLAKKTSKKENLKGLVSAAVGLKDQDKVIDACTLFLKNNKDHDVAITLGYAYETRASARESRTKLDDLNKALEAYQTARKSNPKSRVAGEKIPELKIEILKLKKARQ